ncbi:MAG: hypothetical protein ACYS47_01295 [Planctomycetota bacterium]|jgi:hypothetical protein
MAIINALLFDDRCGAILSDEEYWLLRRRKSYYGDNLQLLLTPEQADRFGVEAVWGICGHPAFGWEVAETLRERIRAKEEEAKKAGRKKPPFTKLHEIGLLAAEVVRETVRRRVNEKLSFLYGFDADDLIRGHFDAEGRRYDIKQSSVKTHAMSILDGSNKAQIFKEVHQNKGILFGFDEEDGLLAYHLNAENFVLSMVSGRFEAVGTGRYAAGMSLADFLGNQTLARRREGHGRTEGALQLILSGVVARRFFHEVGGKLHMVVIDGAGKGHAERCRRIPEDRMTLATEAVEAVRKDLVPEKKALEVVEAMVYGDAPLETGEEILFRAASRPKAMELLFRGYKASELPGGKGGARKKGKERS